MSYAQFDDEHDNNFLTKFRDRLANEVRAQSGVREFTIFQDKISIKWGENWQRRIEETLDSVIFLIPVMTPNFFNSPACLEEIQRFAERERRLGRDDLILPVYYLDARPLEDARIRAEHPVGELLHSRQRVDWRALRGRSIRSAGVEQEIRKLARRIVDSIQPTGGGDPKAFGPAERAPIRARKLLLAAACAVAGVVVAGLVAWKASTGLTGATEAAGTTANVVHQVRSHTLTSSSSVLTCSRDKFDFDTAEPGHGDQPQLNLCRNKGGRAEVVLDPERLHSPGDDRLLLPLAGGRRGDYATCREEFSRRRDETVGSVDLTDLRRGELICVRTDQRLVALMTIDKVVPGYPSTVTFDVTVWRAAG